MADKSAIEWTDATWNPIVGCSIVSPGCTNCYAMKMAARLDKMLPPERRGDAALPHHYTALTKPSKAGPVWTGRVNIAPDHIITQPLRWRRGRRVFVNSMGDLFHESIPDEWIDKVFAVMALCPQHTFQVLTKRAERMRTYIEFLGRNAQRDQANGLLAIWQMRLIDAVPAGKWPVSLADATRRLGAAMKMSGDQDTPSWPFPNVWLGVSTESQQEANERIPDLLATPAVVRFISAEPLLGPINLRRIRIAPCHHTMVDALDGYAITDSSSWSGSGHERAALDWIIVGGESGASARPMHAEWARSLRDQCANVGVPFFFKQWGEWYDEASVSASEFRGTKYESERLVRVGKKAAGRLLDGKEHNAFPQRATPT